MRVKGIAYDTGFVREGGTSRPDFDLGVVRCELTIIRDDLHCDAVHLIGGDPERLESAARVAADLGLAIWFSPYPLELDVPRLLALFGDCAERAERIRAGGAEVVFVAGVELSVMNRGFLPGDTVNERLGHLLAEPEGRAERMAEAGARLDAFFARAVPVVRERFGGRVTYACIQFERIDWSRFDVMSVELIRSAEVADRFEAGVRALVAQDRPVAITGFGTATWRGAADVAPRSMEIVEHDDAGLPVRLDGEYERDEAGQAAYFRELLEIFDAAGVEAAFPFLFALHDYPHRPSDPRRDLDLASLGVVKVLADGYGTAYPDMRWEPKEAFRALAEFYGG